MSILDNVTIEQFKEYFRRDFPFLPYHDISKTYWKDDVVFDGVDFYKSLIDNNTSALSVAAAWQKIKGNVDDYVTDEDIQKAMTQAIIGCNENFGESCTEKTNIYLHLVAYYLVVDLKNSAAGVYSSYVGMTQSKSVGDVSESYAIPAWLQKSPMYSMYGQNGYGLKYLTLIAPYLAVTILLSRGGSTYD